MSTRDRLDRMLDRVPGYAGYRDKERRRESDRAIRDKLEVDYGRLADRLGRFAARLADERRLDAIAAVDTPLGRLRGFLDRVRTATYGYAPIFANDDVDAGVLDQIAAFDSALADQMPAVESGIARLEAADPDSTDFRSAADDLTASIQLLSDRFTKRGEVIHAGKPLPEKDMLGLLGPATPDQPPVVWRLQIGDAISHEGEDYSIIGRVTAEMSQGSRRAYQLRGGDDRQWLEASATHDGPLFWLSETTVDIDGSPAVVTVEGRDYALQLQTMARGQVEGRQGADEQSMRYVEYTAGDRALHIYNWGAQHLALEGVAIDARDIELYTGQR